MAADDNAVTSFSIYDTTTGAIRIAGRMQKQFLASMRQPNEAIVYAFGNVETQFFDTTKSPPRIANRPAFPDFDKLAIKADNTDAATIQVPVDATITVDGVPHAVQPGPFAFKADTPGVYTIAASAFPYVDRLYLITATAS